MALTFGFYNSINHDRRYNALQMSQLFDGIITDGVFMNIGTAMTVTADGGLTLRVGIGRAWFNSTWTLNDAIYPVEATEADVLRDRIDAVVLEVDQRESTRANRIIFKEGVASTDPQKPELVKADGVYQYPLCYISRAAGSTGIAQGNVENCVGTSECPFVTGILSAISTDELVKQWESQFDEILARLEDAIEQTFDDGIADGVVTENKLSPDVRDAFTKRLTTLVVPTGASTMSFTVRGSDAVSSNAWKRQMLNIQAWSQGADYVNMQLMVDATNGAPYGDTPLFMTDRRTLKVTSAKYLTSGNETTYTITFSVSSMWGLGYITAYDGVGMSVVGAEDIVGGSSLAVESISGLAMERIWLTSSSTSNFAAQTLNMDLTKYTHVLVEFVSDDPPVMVAKGRPTYASSIAASATTGFSICVRSITLATAGVQFGAAYLMNYATSSNKFAITSPPTVLKPYAIYGIKGVNV